MTRKTPFGTLIPCHVPAKQAKPDITHVFVVVMLLATLLVIFA